MKIKIDPKVDYAFKHVFGREESKPALISLLDAVFQPGAGQQISSLDLLNPFNDKETPDDKTSVLDIKARDESGRQFNVEMQMLAYGAFRQRALYYWARLHQSQLRKGKDFRLIRPTIAVCFVDTPLFPEIDDFHLIFELRERKRRTLFTDQMAVHILELTKFRKAADELETPLDRWLYFLRHAANLDVNALPVALDVPEVRWALGDLRMISRSKRERERYESRLKMERDVYTALAEKLDEGRAEGLAEGRAEARRELIQYLQKRLRHRVQPLEELQLLSTPELAKLVKRLQAELDKKLANGS
jgi:predicted transposase/invertase (TIGR01784 family)